FRLGGLNFIRTALRQGEADFAIVVYDQNFSQFNKISLQKGLFHLYQHCEATYYQIENGILIDHKEGMYVAELQNFFEQTNRPPLKVQAELAGWEVVSRFTEMNIGIGLFPDYLTNNDRYPKIKIYPQDIPALEYEICAIYN